MQRKNVEFLIEEKDIIIPEFCPILKVKFDSGDYAPSLDKIDNSKGYVAGNIQVISFRANRLKNDSTKEERKLLVAYDERCGYENS